MSNIQIAFEQKREIEVAHLEWLRGRPRVEGQLGVSGLLVEGPPICIPGEITTYSDFEAVGFYGVDPDFVDFLKGKEIPFTEF